jgi:hypothetical protein
MKIKENEDSELWIKVIEGNIIGTDGNTYSKTRWIKADKKINLGSFKDPIKNIVEFKYNIPSDNKNMPNFSNIFKGLGF